MQERIKQMSNEALEQEIAAIYWRGYQSVPKVYPMEKGVLALLWDEFDYRKRKKRI